jgi:hypothetical protein
MKIVEFLLVFGAVVVGAVASTTTAGYNVIARKLGFRILASSGDEEEVITPVEAANILLKFFAILGGLIGLYFVWTRFSFLYFLIFKQKISSSFDLFVTPAFAQAAGSRTLLNNFIPFIFTAVLILISLAFSVALSALLILRDTKENRRRISAADNIVKTFGGFLTGLLTVLLK